MHIQEVKLNTGQNRKRMVLLWSAALCAAGLTNSLKVGLAGVTDFYCKPRLGKLRQTGTTAVWLKTFWTQTNDAAIYTKTIF